MKFVILDCVLAAVALALLLATAKARGIVAVMHRLLGHDRTAALFRTTVGDRSRCALCAAEQERL